MVNMMIELGAGLGATGTIYLDTTEVPGLEG